MKLRAVCRHVTFVIAMALCLTAMAAAPGSYAGAGIGYADVVSDEDATAITAFLQSNGLTATLATDTKNIDVRISGGYWFTENWGVEVSYVTLGFVDVDATITAPSAGTISTNSSTPSGSFLVQYAFPLSDRVDIIGKIGTTVWDRSVDVNFTGSAAGLGTLSTDVDGTAFTVGIGFARELKDKSWLWSAGYQHLDTDRVEGLFSTGFAYRFGQ